ncbi:MAG: hypothetical protein CMF71_03510 [Magnetovibrio sp.]|nr:hypothetical protein [Magnetovibrio sp.]
MIIGPMAFIIWGLWIILCWKEWSLNKSIHENHNKIYKTSLLYPLPVIIWICVISFSYVMTSETN